MKTPWKVIKAAAGTGKTVRLVQEYLDCLVREMKVEQIVAITFTRKAAAELVERVTQVLYLLLEDAGPRADRARELLGKDAEKLYLKAVRGKLDKSAIGRALGSISSAPVGTTDSFIHKLLSEFALDASLPVGREEAFLDYPLTTAGDASPYFEEAARKLANEPGGPFAGTVRLLLERFAMTELVSLLGQPCFPSDARLGSCVEISAALKTGFGAFLRQALGKPASRFIMESYGLDDLAQDDWGKTLEKLTNKLGVDHVPSVTRWLIQGGEEADTPLGVGPMLLNVNKTRKEGKAMTEDVERLAERMAEERLPVQTESGSVPLSWSAWMTLFSGPFADRSACALADEVRGQLHALRGEVTRQALVDAARAGALSYDLLLMAATHLCTNPPDKLRTRFRAILVDEAQDSSPEQVEFYRSLSSLKDDMHCLAVGDSRQSIYLFRGADPEAVEKLVTGKQAEPLLVNWRSTPSLVAAHKAMFCETLRPELEEQELAALDSLQELTHGRKLSPEQDERPVTLILPPMKDDSGEPVPEVRSGAADRAAVAQFAVVVKEHWKRWSADPGAPAPTFAVLAPSWSKAASACRDLRHLLEVERTASRTELVHLDGGGKWLNSRVVKDIILLLTALSNRDDQIAWMGVWKHPIVGLSDRALARIRKNVGFALHEPEDDQQAAGWLTHLGWTVEACGLTAPHDATDIFAFARARPALNEAVGNLGKRGAADTLDLLATRLGWRELLEAAPQDDALAQFEVTLDWIRSMDNDGLPPARIVEALTPTGDETGDIPRLENKRPKFYISCTTLFQAKGLEWDHVCVYSPGVPPDRPGQKDRPPVDVVFQGQRMWLEPLVLDPQGAFSPVPDPIAKLCETLYARKKFEECFRLAYVAVTRARESVVLALPNRGHKPVQAVLLEAWKNVMAGVEHVPWEEADYVAQREYCRVEASPYGAFKDHTLAPDAWQEEAPSGLSGALATPDRLALAKRIAEQVAQEGGFTKGAYAPLTVPDTGLFGRATSARWGDLAHRWFEKWQFGPAPDPTELSAHVKEVFGVQHPAAVNWLNSLCTSLAAMTESPLWKLATSPGTTPYFEWPLVGVCPDPTSSDPAERFLLSGKADLLLRHSDGTWTIIDFKAGKSPTDHDDLLENASLKTYGPQLEAYRHAVNRALPNGERVAHLALWFLQTGACVVWQ